MDQTKIKKCLVLVICMIFIWLSAGFVYAGTVEASAEESAEASQKKEAPDFKPLIGSWVRPDGGYVIEISKVHPDGEVVAAYFNPRSIHVSKASVSEKDGAVELFIKLQDQGYPGSTYTLKYNVEYDGMVGIYYQAAMNQSYDVVFQRKE